MSNTEQNVTSNIEGEIVQSNRILSLSGGGVKGIAELALSHLCVMSKHWA